MECTDTLIIEDWIGMDRFFDVICTKSNIYDSLGLYGEALEYLTIYRRSIAPAKHYIRMVVNSLWSEKIYNASTRTMFIGSYHQVQSGSYHNVAEGIRFCRLYDPFTIQKESIWDRNVVFGL